MNSFVDLLTNLIKISLCPEYQLKWCILPDNIHSFLILYCNVEHSVFTKTTEILWKWEQLFDSFKVSHWVFGANCFFKETAWMEIYEALIHAFITIKIGANKNRKMKMDGLCKNIRMVLVCKTFLYQK